MMGPCEDGNLRKVVSLEQFLPPVLSRLPPLRRHTGQCCIVRGAGSVRREGGPCSAVSLTDRMLPVRRFCGSVSRQRSGKHGTVLRDTMRSEEVGFGGCW